MEEVPLQDLQELIAALSDLEKAIDDLSLKNEFYKGHSPRKMNYQHLSQILRSDEVLSSSKKDALTCLSVLRLMELDVDDLAGRFDYKRSFSIITQNNELYLYRYTSKDGDVELVKKMDGRASDYVNVGIE